MNSLAKILQNSKTIHTNHSFLASIPIHDFMKLTINLPYFNPSSRNKIKFIDYDKVNNIANYHYDNYINNNNYKTINGVLTLNATKNSIYILDGVHRYKAFNKLYNKYNVHDFNVNIEYWNVDNKDDVLTNYNYIHNTNVKNIKRKNIPNKVKENVWNKYIGEKYGTAKCYVCRNSIINKKSFICGHVVPVILGGDDGIKNLRPICKACSISMGWMNMEKYINKYYPENHKDFIHYIPSLKYPEIYFKPIPLS
tara:strand:- start:56 stop:814 length:759 start_codon:yes stop_codon:yes gene_type:complete